MANIIENYKQSLSFKLLTLIAACVLVAEAVVLVPSIAYHRLAYLQERVEAAYLLGFALESQDDGMLDRDVANQLFSTAGIEGVSIMMDGAQILILDPTIKEIDIDDNYQVDLTTEWPSDALTAPWATLFSKGDRLIGVIGTARVTDKGAVNMFVSQAAMREDLFRYASNIFGLSLVISSLTALFVYVRMNQMIVAPVKQLSANMKAFEQNPERIENLLAPGERGDEIGVAERSLAALEHRLQDLLSERRRLATLGAGISKISHDLRNILASAQLMSDRLSKSDDPRVRKLSPRLIGALDRAIALSRDTLSYARMAPSSLKKEIISLHGLVNDVLDDNANMDISFTNNVSESVVVKADPTQLYRSLFNLVKNAVEALTDESVSSSLERAPEIEIRSDFKDEKILIHISDNGPGLPEAAQQGLFEPFKGSQKAGGSGLGVAIAHEIARAHGGDLILKKSDANGVTFTLTLPAIAQTLNVTKTNDPKIGQATVK